MICDCGIIGESCFYLNELTFKSHKVSWGRRGEIGSKSKKKNVFVFDFKEIVDLVICFSDKRFITFSKMSNSEVLISEKDKFQLKSLNLIVAIININKF